MATSNPHYSALVITHHGVIAHQTDTIFGLACLPQDHLLNRLSQIKKRPRNKPFLLLASHIEHVTSYIDASEEELKVLTTPTSTPTTYLVKAAKNISSQLIGENNKVAVRLTSYAPIKLLCDQVGAIASTSANISTLDVCININQIRAMFGPNIDYIDPNQTPGTGKSSTIVDLANGEIIRR